MSEQVILVNQNDQALNYMYKAEAHQKVFDIALTPIEH